MSDLVRVNRLIVKLRQRLEALKTTAETLQNLDSIEKEITGSAAGSSTANGKADGIPGTGKTVADLAEMVFRNNKEAELHYKQVAQEGAALGLAASPDTVRRAMTKRRDRFEQRGGGIFRLRQNAADKAPQGVKNQ